MRNAIFNDNAPQDERSLAERTLAAELTAAAPNAAIPMDGTTMTTTQVVGVIDEHLAAMADVRALQIALTAAIAKEHELRTQVKSVAGHVRDFAKVMFGVASRVYAVLGFAQTKPRAPTSQVLKQAVEKRLATRAVHHIMGPRQRARIKGVLPAASEPAVAATNEPTQQNTASTKGAP